MSTSSTFSQEGDCERSAIAIAWSCMTVIIACTWKAVHPNVPPANLRASKWTLACRRLYMTFWTILLPELVIWRAAREWFEARHLSATYKQEYSGDTESNAPGEQSKYRKFCIFLSGLVTGPPKEAYWTKVHSFFLIMGGFVTAEGDLIIPEDLGIDKGTTRKVDWPMVEEDEINDKSKGDMITKALVVWQTTWFVIQLVARIVEGLAITELEVMTLAYGLMCALLYGLWWNKPYDVHKPITTTSTSSPLKYSKPFNEVATEIKEETTKEETTQEERPKEEEGSALKIEDFLFGTWITVLDNRIFEGTGLYCRDQGLAILLFLTSATIFGSIHCIAWKFQFPTLLERILWISSSLVAAAIPCFSVVLLIFVHHFASLYDGLYEAIGKSVFQRSFAQLMKELATLSYFFCFSILAYMYCLARIVLIVQAFVLLRHLSPSAAQSISWSHFIPHV
ncbi:hypothetical protein AB1N83_012888 [Pleurotus pulmonarius]